MATIWRYMSFAKFVAMLDTHALFFSRPYRFDDPWDGHSPPSYLRYLREVGGPDPNVDREFETRFRRRRYGYFVSCWHQSEQECLAMWKLYGASTNGVAIQSWDFVAMECLRPHSSGSVRYYDPNELVTHESLFGPDDILYKRHYFQFEQEWRMWCVDDEVIEQLEQPEFDVMSLTPGIQQAITDMERFISRIVVAPAATDSFVEKVKRTCIEHKKQWLAKRVERSPYDLDPTAFS